MSWQRTMVTTGRYRSEQLTPGVVLESFYPGGKDGPNGEVLSDCPGGQVWSDIFSLGDSKDPFQLSVPDIRLPANQIWPLHWHDCWVGIVILEGECLIGDWWMKPGDVLITEACIEYGPLLIGPRGCRMFEVFARLHQHAGGYALEYRDHPTLQGTQVAPKFAERSALNKRNEGRQCLPLEGKGFTKGTVSHGLHWDLGEHDDPDRGVMKVSRFSSHQRMRPHLYKDWHTCLVLDGTLQIGGRMLVNDDYLLIRPNSRVDEISAGRDGALLLELARTSRGIDAQAVA
jgi:hypothetical protein